jgi:hypothetical protein
MMRAMKKALVGVAVGLAALAAAACGGGGKDAESPGTCPEGTVLKGSDCVPAETAGDTSGSGGGDDSPKKSAHKKKSEDAEEESFKKREGDESAASGGGSGGYDKDAVEAQMKRATKQIKSNCGSATDDEGKATGPWGTVSANIVLGRNGHIKDVTVPDPYNGKPVGICVVRALQKIQFPPYAGSSDVSISRDFEVTKPK